MTTGWVVMKFGGTSVARPDHWNRIVDAAKAALQSGQKVLIVHSALAGVSNLLEQLPQAVLNGQGDPVKDEIKVLHETWLDAAGLEAPAAYQVQIERMNALCAGIHLVEEASPRVRAELLSLGELMASALGHAWLEQAGLSVDCLDAREFMTGLDASTHLRAYLDNTISTEPDPALQERLKDCPIAMTQGFIARNQRGETVLLGRGGSDTSASILAAKLQADALQIWTDVPGLFSADPHLTSGARLLKALSYEEAQEIATMGGKVLHPRAIGPAREAGIPVSLHDTFRPEIAGTRITATPGDDSPRLKAVSIKKGVRLVVMEGSGMWRQAGFLADIFACFKESGISIDQVSTSETNVTVSLDPDPGLTQTSLNELKDRLQAYCRVRIVDGAAAISLLGYGIRRVLHQLAPALEAFQDKPIRMVSQAANDLNFTVIVDESQGEALARRLHNELIASQPADAVFGPSWSELSEPAQAERALEPAWWDIARQALINKAPDEGGLYVYDPTTVRQRARDLMGLTALDRGFFAIKANPHPDILKLIENEGLGFECVSLGEVERVRETLPDISADRILFTPNFAPRREYEAALALGIHLTIDGLHPLQHWPEVFAGRQIILRINPDTPRGHHRHVRTAGPKAKFGIPLDQLDEAKAAVEAAGASVIGLHAHAGSGVTDPAHWKDMGAVLANAAATFGTVRHIDLGGGLGIPESTGQARIDLAALDDNLKALKAASPGLELWMEPGRYLVAEAGVLITRVQQIKHSFGSRFIGLGTGMNSLIRPALYGARHEIVNLSRLDEPTTGLASFVGPICESADLIGADRLMPDTTEGDVILIANTGAYGAVMSSRYNLREPAAEVMF